MKESDVIHWLISECESLLASTSLVSVSTPSDHVDVAENRDNCQYPFIGIQGIASTSESQGIGNGDVYVEDTTYESGVIQSITYGRDVTFRVNVIPVTSNDEELRDDLYTVIGDHFMPLARNDALPSDMSDLDVEEATPQDRSSEFVYQDGIPMDVEYSRYVTYSDVTAAETVNVDVDVSAVPESDGTLTIEETLTISGTRTVNAAVDAFDESFT